jgi:hypothetical protein
MAGLAGLSELVKTDQNEEPASSVPRGTSEYAEPYEPSALTRGM